MVGRGDDDGVDVLASQQFAEVVVGVQPLYLPVFAARRSALHGLLGVLAAGRVHVADGQHLHVLLAEEVAEWPRFIVPMPMKPSVSRSLAGTLSAPCDVALRRREGPPVTAAMLRWIKLRRVAPRGDVFMAMLQRAEGEA